MQETGSSATVGARAAVAKFSGIASQPAETSTLDYPKSWSGQRGWMRVESIPVKGRQCRKKPPPRLYKLRGYGISNRVGCHQHNSTNLAISVYQRVLTVCRDGQQVETTPPAEQFYREQFAPYVDELKRYSFVTPPVSRALFCERYKANGRRYRNYLRAVANLEHMEKHNTLNLQQLSRLSNFVKVEKVLQEKLSKAPRNISPRAPEFNVLLGCYIAHLEKALFRILERVCGFPVVFKGMNALKQGEVLRHHWDSFVDPVAIDLDASRFDQHQHVPSLKVEHEQWLRMVPAECRDHLQQLLKCQLLNNGSAVFPQEGIRVKYQVKGTRASGDMNTSSGNCFTMVGLIYSYMHGKCKWRLANNGDDCVLIIERRDLPKIADLVQWFSEMGYTMESEGVVDIFERISFCQTRPVWTPNGYKMVRNPWTALAKDIHSRCDLSREDVYDLWTSCVGKGGLALAGDIPVYNKFYQTFPQKDSAADAQEVAATVESGFYMLSKGLNYEHAEILPRTRYSFWLAFGITPLEQRVLEDHFSGVQVRFQEPSNGELHEGCTIDLLLNGV
nr:RNA-dependent RNA polymerase [Tolivirales sp. gcode 6]